MGRLLKWNMLYEYRIWPDAEDGFENALRQNFRVIGRERRTDDYLLPIHMASAAFLPKIRGGKKFEIKQRIRSDSSGEVWRRIVSERFPLDPALQSVLEGIYGGVPLPARCLEAPVRLLAALAPHVFVCRVIKNRTRLRSGACKGEITTAGVFGKEALTIALECRKPGPVADFLRELPGPPPPNTDYGTWLRGQLRQRVSLSLVKKEVGR